MLRTSQKRTKILNPIETSKEKKGINKITTLGTYSIRIHFFTGSAAGAHHRLQDGHPALLVREAGSHEVEGLARPAGGVGMRLQLQHVWDVWERTKTHIESSVTIPFSRDTLPSSENVKQSPCQRQRVGGFAGGTAIPDLAVLMSSEAPTAPWTVTSPSGRHNSNSSSTLMQSRRKTPQLWS